MATMGTQISDIWKKRRIHFCNELVNHYFFNSLSGSVYFSEPLVKISEKAVRPNLWNKKVPFNKILYDRFFLFFNIAQSLRLSICVQNFRAPYRGRFENNNIFFLKNCAANVFSSFHHWNDIREHLFAGAYSTRGKVYMQQCTFEFRELSISTVLQYNLVVIGQFQCR